MRRTDLMGLARDMTTPLPPQGESTTSDGVSSLQQLPLGDSSQWVLMSGRDTTAPVVLLLTGGLGGSDIAGVRRLLGEIEDHCVVVTWDQRGTGKSLRAGYPPSSMTMRQLTSDALELVSYLRKRFGQRKIFLVARSVGTVIAVRMMQERPEWFHAYVGLDQIVNPVERDRAAWDKALASADRAGRAGATRRLRRAGSPPYTGRWSALRYIILSRAAHRFLDEDLGLPHLSPRRPARAPAFGPLTPARRAFGLIRTLRLIYPRLQRLDLVRGASRLDVPTYLVTGTKTTTSGLVERYHQALECPHKELVRWEDIDRLDEWFVATVLPRAAQSRPGSPVSLGSQH